MGVRDEGWTCGAQVLWDIQDEGRDGEQGAWARGICILVDHIYTNGHANARAPDKRRSSNVEMRSAVALPDFRFPI